jgi:cation diffusion facilitator family transporter
VLAAGCVNALLGFYLVRVGTRHRSIILEANGKHVLSDSWTSFGVAGALVLVNWTGWSFFDPAVAMLVAITILWSGGRLVWRSVAGLMDYSDPKLGRQLSRVLNQLCKEFGVEYHNLRFRSAGRRLFVELHLLFPQEVSLGEAHRRATDIEQRLAAASPVPAEITTHLEALEDHGQVHPEFPQNGGHAGA